MVPPELVGSLLDLPYTISNGVHTVLLSPVCWGFNFELPAGESVSKFPNSFWNDCAIHSQQPDLVVPPPESTVIHFQSTGWTSLC
jgi:hypothetical protein